MGNPMKLRRDRVGAFELFRLLFFLSPSRPLFRSRRLLYTLPTDTLVHMPISIQHSSVRFGAHHFAHNPFQINGHGAHNRPP